MKKEYGAVINTTITTESGNSLSFYKPRLDQNRHFFTTSDESEQETIESHPWFKQGLIYLIAEIDDSPKHQVPEPGTGKDEQNAGGNETGEDAQNTGNTETGGADEANAQEGSNDEANESDANNAGNAETAVTDPAANTVQASAQDEELLAVTSTQKAIVYLTGKGFELSAIPKAKQDVIDFAAKNNIVFPNWIV